MSQVDIVEAEQDSLSHALHYFRSPKKEYFRAYHQMRSHACPSTRNKEAYDSFVHFLVKSTVQ